MECQGCGQALTGQQKKWCSRACTQAGFRSKNPMYHRYDAWTRTGGKATFEEYSEVVLLTTRCEACDIYVHDLTDRRVDHDHATGEIRGMLCDCCNTTEGKYNGDIARISGLVDYLERTSNVST